MISRRWRNMYCSSCGAAVTQSLSYCNRCGAKLGGTEHGGLIQSPGPKPEFLVAAMISAFTFGLIAIAGLMAVLRGLPGFDFGRIMAVMLLCFLIMVSVEVVFAWLLLRRRSAVKETGGADSLKEQRATNELDAARARSLPDPVPSVTESTTRLFEPASAERRNK
jgi:hypothetical protein